MPDGVLRLQKVFIVLLVTDLGDKQAAKYIDRYRVPEVGGFQVHLLPGEQELQLGQCAAERANNPTEAGHQTHKYHTGSQKTGLALEQHKALFHRDALLLQRQPRRPSMTLYY